MSLIWGTIRMLAHTQEAAFWANFFRDLHPHNIHILHSSLEYNSFPLLCEVLCRLREDGITFRHMVKPAEPSFAENRFSPDRLLAKLQVYQHLLGNDTIYPMQWMWYRDLQQETNRVAAFTQQHADIHRAFAHHFTFSAQLVTTTIFAATRPLHLDQVLTHIATQNASCPS